MFLFTVLLLTPIPLSLLTVRGHPCATTEVQCTDYQGYSLECTFQTSDASNISTIIMECSREANDFMSKSYSHMQFYFLNLPTGTIYLDISDNIGAVRFFYYPSGASDCINIALNRTHSHLSAFQVDNSQCIYFVQSNFLDYLPNIRSLTMQKVKLNEFILFQGHNLLEHFLSTDMYLSSGVFLNSSLFSEFPKLRNLYLYQSSFSWYNITANTFDPFTNLIQLAFGSRYLNHIFPNQFVKLTRLVSLYVYLSRNAPYTVIDDGAFNGLNVLTQLTFRYTFDMQKLENTTFPNLRTIYFTSCDLTRLNSEFFQLQSKLQTVEANGNPFHCDCEMQWTSIVSQTFNLAIRGSCSTPSALGGKSITDYSNYLSCNQTESYQCFNRSFICPENSTCKNTIDSAYCDCNEGYQLFENECRDMCGINNGDCEHNCFITNGLSYCSCSQGYNLKTDFRSCQDVNECINLTHNCQQVCVNTNGSFYCSCLQGYMLDGNSCLDIDECTNNTHTCEQICINTNGSYLCDCLPGFNLTLTGNNCSDLDECLINNGGCNQTCSNTNGSFYCSCVQGYTLDVDQESCLDVNECTMATHNCQQICVNTNGSYSCDCLPGFSLNTTGHCFDIDECLVNNGDCQHSCFNTNGSYYCSCLQGYKLDTNGTSCLDVNECTNATHYCEQICVNTNGSYFCDCLTGFNLTATGNNCSDIDECALNNGYCHQICNNSIGTYTCGCERGFHLSSDDYLCLDINECLTDFHTCEDVCINTIGSYACYTPNC